MSNGFLPISKQDMIDEGIEQLDFVSDSAEEMELVEKQEESRVEREIKREELYRKSTGADYTALEDLTDEKC